MCTLIHTQKMLNNNRLLFWIDDNLLLNNEKHFANLKYMTEIKEIIIFKFDIHPDNKEWKWEDDYLNDLFKEYIS